MKRCFHSKLLLNSSFILAEKHFVNEAVLSFEDFTQNKSFILAEAPSIEELTKYYKIIYTIFRAFAKNVCA